MRGQRILREFFQRSMRPTSPHFSRHSREGSSKRRVVLCQHVDPGSGAQNLLEQNFSGPRDGGEGHLSVHFDMKLIRRGVVLLPHSQSFVATASLSGPLNSPSPPLPSSSDSSPNRV